MARSPGLLSERGRQRLCLAVFLLSLLVTPARNSTAGPTDSGAAGITGRAESGAPAKEQAGSPPQAELLRRLQESRAPYHTFATRFVQRKHLAILDVDLQSEGMIFFRRPPTRSPDAQRPSGPGAGPGSVRYEMLAPVRSLMTYDGKKVQCYTFTEGAWKLLNNPAATAIGQVLRQIGRWIQGDFDSDRKMFDIDVVPADNYAGCIRLTPRNEALAKYIQRVEIYVEKAPEYRVTRVIMRESDVDLTDMRFRQELRNPSIPEGTFSAPEASGACVGIFPPEDRADPNESKRPQS